MPAEQGANPSTGSVVRPSAVQRVVGSLRGRFTIVDGDGTRVVPVDFERMTALFGLAVFATGMVASAAALESTAGTPAGTTRRPCRSCSISSAHSPISIITEKKRHTSFQLLNDGESGASTALSSC